MVERFQRTLKVMLAAHESPHWTTKLPIVLLALHNMVKPDIGQTPAEYFHPAQSEPRPPDLVAFP